MAVTLFILNDAPYGTERSYNALRLAGALARREAGEVRVFLIGDAAACAKAGQKVPQGYYNLEVMLRGVARHGGQIGVCGTCMDARGIVDQELAEGCGRSNGQKGGFTKHGSLLCDPWTASWRIVDCLSADRSMQLWQRFRPGMPKSGLNP